MAPTLRSRLGQPSSRWPMPGANESSTVEWQSAQLMPIDLRLAIVVEMTFDAHDSIQLEQSKRRRRIIEIDLALFQLRDEACRKGIHIYFEADGRGRSSDSHPRRRRQTWSPESPCEV